MVVETAAPRTLPRRGGAARARGSCGGPSNPSASDLDASCLQPRTMTQPVSRISVPAALALGSAALGAAFASGLFLGK